MLSEPVLVPLSNVSFTIPAEELPAEGGTITVRVIDAAGNSTDQTVELPSTGPPPLQEGDGEAVGWLWPHSWESALARACSSGARSMPRSVRIALTRWWGVTSNAGL